MKHIVLFFVIAIAFSTAAQTPSSQSVIRTFRTLAEMDASDPSRTEVYTEVMGLTYAGQPGWPLKFRYEPTNSAPTNMFCRALPRGKPGRRVHDWNSDATAFGAIGDGVTDSAEAINAALLYAHQSRIGKVYLPPGHYTISTTLVVRPNTLLMGDWASFIETSSILTNSTAYRVGGSTWISLRASANCPMVDIVTNGATHLRQTVGLYDGTIHNQYYVNSGLRDIALIGNAGQQTRYDCHAITAKHGWNITLERVTVQNPRGLCLSARNLNAFRVHGCNFVPGTLGRNVLLDDVADATVSDNYFFGGNGPIIWINGASGWKCKYVGNLMGNSYAETVKDVTFSGSTLTLTNHLYETGDMVMFQPGTGGTMPSPLSSNTVFFVVKQTDNTFGISTNLVANEAGTTTSLSGGSGGLQVYRGRPVGVFISNGRMHTFTGNRIDQPFNENVYIQGGTYNTFIGNELSEAGTFGTPSITTNLVAAVTLSNGATRNLILGNHGTGADYAYKIDDSSMYNYIGFNSFLNNVAEYNASALALSQNPSGGFNAIGTGTRFRGGAGGQPVVSLYREQLATEVGLRVIANGIYFVDETQSRFIAELSNSGSEVILRGGAPESFRPSDAADFKIIAESPSGTNTSASAMQLIGSRATGDSASGGQIELHTSDITTSGTNLQAHTAKLTVHKQGNVQLKEIQEPTANTPGSFFNGVANGITNWWFRVGSAWRGLVSSDTNGLVTIGSSNVANTLRVVGALGGQRSIIMERPGVATNGLGTSDGGFSVVDEGRQRFIITAQADDASASLYLGGANYANLTTGRTAYIFGQSANLSITNADLPGGDTRVYAGAGKGSAALSSFRVLVPVLGSSGTNEQTRRTMLEVKHPDVLSVSNNTGLKLPYWNGSNYVTMRCVLTNEAGQFRSVWIPE
jgi:hypothetical protein